MSEASAAAASAGDFSKPSTPSASSAERPAEASEPSPLAPPFHIQTSRLLILAVSAVSFAVFWIVGGWLDVPEYRRFEGSLMQQPGLGCLLDFVVAALMLAGFTVVGHFVAGRRWLYAGPFAAAFGLMAWTCRSGASRYVYQHAATVGDGRSIFLLLALETAVLSLLVGAMWYFVATRGIAMAQPAPAETSRQPTDLTVLRPRAIVAQIVMTVLLVMLLTPVDAKKGALASVFIASFLAASITEYYLGEAKLAAWYWLAPAVTGILGYLLNYIANAAGAPNVTGHLIGAFAPLARPLPLDYASAGMFAALLGFWTGGEHPDISVGMDVFRARHKKSA